MKSFNADSSKQKNSKGKGSDTKQSKKNRSGDNKEEADGEIIRSLPTLPSRGAPVLGLRLMRAVSLPLLWTLVPPNI